MKVQYKGKIPITLFGFAEIRPNEVVDLPPGQAAELLMSPDWRSAQDEKKRRGADGGGE